MQKLKAALMILACAGIVVALSGGPDPGKTGAPGEEDACTECHMGVKNPDTRGRLVIEGVPVAYVPGERYTITVSLSHPDRRLWGFQLTVLSQNGDQPAGDLVVTNKPRTQQMKGGPGGMRQYIEHTILGTDRGRSGGTSWTFDWTAPSESIGPVVFYAAGNAANGDNASTSDKIYTTSVISFVPFDEIAEEAGLTGGGNGIAWGDYNGDGFPDLYVARGGQNLLFHNDGDGTFTERAMSLGIGDTAQGQAAAWFDYDNDNDLDLFVANIGQSRLYRNDGGIKFTEVTTMAGLQGQMTSFAIAVTDYDKDGDLDVFLANDGADALYSNNANGSFTNVAMSLGLADSRQGRVAAWGDFDGDGVFDLFVANIGADFLYRRNANTPGSKFEDIAAAAGVADTAAGFAAAWADYDQDGRLDLFVANDGLDFLYRNRGDGTFENVAGKVGITGQGKSRSAAWEDFDGDGDRDLFVTNTDDEDFFYRNDGRGGFEQVTAPMGIMGDASGRAAAWRDFDKDGDPDLLVASAFRLFLYRNPRFKGG
jgi:hypothetical protein